MDFEFRVYRVWGLGFRDEGLESRDKGLGLRVLDLELWV